jgi:transposase
MEVVYRNCCGLDVHKAVIVACVIHRDGAGHRHQEVRSFGTTTRELLQLSDWLEDHGCTHVAMESSGVYWKPVYNVLEGTFELLLVNAAHIKNVPGRKTDVKDCEWIAQLLECGLLRKSFVPPVMIRQLRDWTRRRRTLKRQRASEVNRVQKILEDCNIKLGDVASDIMGKSAQRMLRALIGGDPDAQALADLALGKLRKKKEELKEALTGRVTDHHRRLLQEVLDHIEYLDRAMARCTDQIETMMRPYEDHLERLDGIPGVNREAAQDLVAEIGMDMSIFPSDGHLASWGGICPGNHESAGKRKSGKSRKGNQWLRAVLHECAWAGSRQKDSYLHAQYHRLAGRRGKKKAVKAVAHSQLCAAYFLLRDQVAYHDLGANYFDTLHRGRITQHHLRRLEALGYRVTIEAATMPA